MEDPALKYLEKDVSEVNIKITFINMYFIILPFNVLKRMKLVFQDFCLIQSFNDLKDVEPHKFVFIFLECNDRNIILENENQEIGDLRNQITKVFISIGCKLFH